MRVASAGADEGALTPGTGDDPDATIPTEAGGSGGDARPVSLLGSRPLGESSDPPVVRRSRARSANQTNPRPGPSGLPFPVPGAGPPPGGYKQIRAPP
ncbi:MAG: hypothetical protein IRZ08_22015, partial [Frankia sp.]|nr:hypothetical protein [Frankia sp.]